MRHALERRQRLAEGLALRPRSPRSPRARRAPPPAPAGRSARARSRSPASPARSPCSRRRGDGRPARARSRRRASRGRSARWPWQSKRLRVRPGRSVGTSSAVTPCAPDSTAPVRPKTTTASAWSAAEIEVFSPLITYSSPMRSTRRRRLAASEPPRGSVSAMASSASPRVSRSSQGLTTSGRPCCAQDLAVQRRQQVDVATCSGRRARSPRGSRRRPGSRGPARRSASGSSGAMKPISPISRISRRSSTRVLSRSRKPGATRSVGEAARMVAER